MAQEAILPSTVVEDAPSPSVSRVAGGSPLAIQFVLERLDLHIEALKDVPSQLQALEHLPTIMSSLAAKIDNIENKLDASRNSEDVLETPQIPSRLPSFSCLPALLSRRSSCASSCASTHAADLLQHSPRKLKLLSTIPSTRRGSILCGLPEAESSRTDSEFANTLPCKPSSERVHEFPLLHDEADLGVSDVCSAWEEKENQSLLTGVLSKNFWVMTAASSAIHPNFTKRWSWLSNEMTTLSNYTLCPRSRLRLVWDAAIIVTTFFAGTMIPLMLSYYYCLSRTTPSVLSFFVHYWFDSVWLIDIIVNLRTGFISGGELHMDQYSIAKHYAKRWLIPDLLANFPVALFHKHDSLYVAACLLKLLRLLQVGSRSALLRSEYLANWFLSEVLILFALISHIMACLWRVALSADGLQDRGESMWTQYVSDAYWVIMTLTSTGYGDILPLGSISQLYALAIMIVGVMLSALVVSAFALLTRKYFNDETKAKVNEITRFMVRRGVPKVLQREVQNNLRQQLQYKTAIAVSRDILLNLSPAMQRQLCLSVLRNTVWDFPLFRNSQRSFVAELAHAHCWEQVLAGDLVVDEGHAVQDVTFIIEGWLQAWTPPSYGPGEFDTKVSNWAVHLDEESSKDKYCVEIHSGAWFGEASLFDRQRVYTSMLVAASASELAALPSCEYLRIVQKYPGLWKRHQMIEEQIRNGEVCLTDLRFMRQCASSRRRSTCDNPDEVGNFKADMRRDLGKSPKGSMNQVIPLIS